MLLECYATNQQTHKPPKRLLHCVWVSRVPVFRSLMWLEGEKQIFFFFFCVPSCIFGVHHFGWDCSMCDRFLNPTTEVVQFCLCGWCMLGVFLLLAFTHLEHECQDHWVHGMECMCALTRPLFVLSLKRVLESRVRTYVNCKWKIPSTRESEESRTCAAASCRTASPTLSRLSCSGPKAGFDPHVLCFWRGCLTIGPQRWWRQVQSLMENICRLALCFADWHCGANRGG